jgi:hypothetical protein
MKGQVSQTFLTKQHIQAALFKEKQNEILYKNW